VRRLVVGDHEPLVVVELLEEVVHALAIHQPLDEREVVLAILAHVLQLFVLAHQLKRVVGGAQAARLQHRCDDLGHGPIGEDAAVVGERQLPQLRDERQQVERALILLIHQLEGRDHTVVLHRRIQGAAVDAQRRPRSQQLAHVEVHRVWQREAELEAIGRAQRLTAVKTDQLGLRRKDLGREGADGGGAHPKSRPSTGPPTKR
jgi:hypothetical protein